MGRSFSVLPPAQPSFCMDAAHQVEVGAGRPLLNGWTLTLSPTAHKTEKPVLSPISKASAKRLDPKTLKGQPAW